MVFDGPICALFEPTDIGTLSARERALCDFGPSALVVNSKEKSKTMADATETFKFRLPLRQIAKALGKVEKELDAIRMTVPQLQDLIRTDVANIDSMSFDEVTALAAELSSGKAPTVTTQATPKAEPVATPTPAVSAEAPAKRGPGRPPKPKTPGTPVIPKAEIAEEEPVAEAAPVEEQVVTRVLPSPTKPGPKVPMRRGAAPVVETPVSAIAESAPTTVGVGDLSVVLSALEDLRKRVDIIGQQSDLINSAVKELQKNVKRVEEGFGVQDDRISAIVGALSFMYAEATGDEEGTSIEEIDWSQFLSRG